MGIHVIKMPDIGEGIAEVELVAWHVKVGDMVAEDQPLADVDDGHGRDSRAGGRRVVALGGEVGQVMAVGGELIRLEVDGEGNLKPGADAPPAAGRCRGAPAAAPQAPVEASKPAAAVATAPARPPRRHRPPRGSARRRRASARREAAGLAGRAQARLGPGYRAALRARQRPGRPHPARGSGRLSADRGAAGQARGGVAYAERNDEENVPVIGLRRKIAQKMAESKRRIPHFSYVEEIDVTELEELRASLNQKWAPRAASSRCCRCWPAPWWRCAISRRSMRATTTRPAWSRAMARSIGIATQSDGGLMVPVMRHAEARDLWSMAAEIIRLAEAVRTGAASRDELSGSTITITSLGPLGGIVTTPVINHPEVGIVGVNRIVERPAIRNGAVVARKLMNLSSSFDHRVVDAWTRRASSRRCARCLNNPRCFSWSKHEPDHKTTGLLVIGGGGRLRGRHPRRSAGRAHHPGRRRPAGRHLPEHRLHPSKALIHAAEEFDKARHYAGESALGISVQAPSIDIARTVVWKDGIVSRLTSGVGALLKKNASKWCAAGPRCWTARP